jgi:hypothetical protein
MAQLQEYNTSKLDNVTLSEEDLQILRYVGGIVVRSLQKHASAKKTKK